MMCYMARVLIPLSEARWIECVERGRSGTIVDGDGMGEEFRLREEGTEFPFLEGVEAPPGHVCTGGGKGEPLPTRQRQIIDAGVISVRGD